MKRQTALINISHALCWAAAIILSAKFGASKEMTTIFLPAFAATSIIITNSKSCRKKLS